MWWPFYPLSAATKVVCALASVPTAILFGRETPTLAKSIRRFLDMQTTTEHQRDEALVALTASETVVAERQEAAKKLAAVYSQLTAVLESTSDSVMTIGHDWTLLYCNQRAANVLPEFTIGENYWELFPRAQLNPSGHYLRTAMEQRVETDYEAIYEPTGRWYKVHIYPTDYGVSIFFSDITEAKKMREQLAAEQMLREKRVVALSHMAGGLAHEISNPLAIIHGTASDLRRLADEQEQLASVEVGRACDTIVQTSDRASRILRGLRGFAGEAAKDPMAFASIYEIAEQCIEMQKDRFDHNQVEIRQHLQPDIPLLLCREIQIEQILTNLLNNAFDAIVQSHSVERWVLLTVEYGNGDLSIDVTDSGPGVEEQFRAHLMEPFFTTKEFGLGMGIGLSLSRAIAQDHGGSLSLRTDTKHTCFRLILPIGQNGNGEGAEENLDGVPYQI